MTNTIITIIIIICLILYVVLSCAERVALKHPVCPSVLEHAEFCLWIKQQRRRLLKIMLFLFTIAVCIALYYLVHESAYERGVYEANHLKIYPSEEAGK